MTTQVNEIYIRPIKPVRDVKYRDSLVGLATCVLDGKFFIGSIGIYEKEDGSYRLTYPTKKKGRSSLKLFYPINEETGKDIEDAIVDEYMNLMKADL